MKLNGKIPAIRKDVGYFLRVWRAERDLQQADAAELFGINASHWSLIESGRRHASPKLAYKIAAVTGAPVKMLLGVK